MAGFEASNFDHHWLGLTDRRHSKANRVLVAEDHQETGTDFAHGICPSFMAKLEEKGVTQ